MSFFRFFLISSLILATSALAADPAAIVEKALGIKKEVETANRADLEGLYKDVQSLLSKMTEKQKTDLPGKIKTRLLDDKKAFREIRAALLAKKEGTYELKTSLVKLIGIEGADGTVLFSGILDDAATLLDEGALEKTLDEINPKRNAITVLKTLLIYAKVIATDQSNLTELVEEGSLEGKVQMLYATPFPDGFDAKLAGSVTLSCLTPKSKRLFIPNAGYVFGGNFVDGKCRGVDCSAFVSHCADARVRMSTLYLDFLWRELREDKFTADEKVIRQELIEQWKFLESTKDFEAIEPILARLQPGDLITWRKTTGSSGHTAIFLSLEEGTGKFMGVEANRADNKKKEGIEINPFSLPLDEHRTTVLRRR